jgi:hypothetical protein
MWGVAKRREMTSMTDDSNTHLIPSLQLPPLPPHLLCLFVMLALVELEEKERGKCGGMLVLGSKEVFVDVGSEGEGEA